MLPRELLKAVKHLEILARRAVNDQLAGQYHSVFKGRGMDFVDVRPYQPGDDIRFIDWNVSARLDELHIKRFVEERELTVFLIVDVSGSQLFGTQLRRKQEAAAELASLIAFSAIQNNDRVGLIIFSDRIERFIPPKKGKKHVLRVITEILTCEPVGKRTDIAGALEYLTRINRKKSVAFIISDFQDQDFTKALDIAQRRHELVPVVITDPMEEKLPSMGIVQVEDPETGAIVAIDTSSKKVRDAFAAFAKQQRHQREQAFQRLKIDSVQVRTDEDHIRPLITYFRQRARRH
jgi:uncharacterized protein (DUF58 family)